MVAEWLHHHLLVCRGEPTFEAISVLKLTGLHLWLLWEEQFFRVAGYLPVCRHNPTSKTMSAEMPTSFHAQFLTGMCSIWKMKGIKDSLSYTWSIGRTNESFVQQSGINSLLDRKLRISFSNYLKASMNL